MNEHDRNNLQFLLNASEATLRDWYITVSDDDHVYASELLDQYAAELRNQNPEEIFFEAQLAVSPWPEAEALLNKFRLNKE